MASASDATVARVLVDVGARQVDRLFDFSIPQKLVGAAVVGARVRVRFSGRLVNGFIISLEDSSDFGAELKPIERVLGPAVLVDEVASLTRQVAQAYVGIWSDVVRSAIPPRHVEAEKLVGALPVVDQESMTSELDSGARTELARYTGGLSMFDRLASFSTVKDVSGTPTRVSFTVSPSVAGEWLLAQLVAALPGTTLLLAPDSRSVGRIRAALRECVAAECRVEVLDSAEAPRSRYTAFLRALRGEVDVLVGTRDAVFAPLPTLSRIVIWDEGSDHYRDQRSPRWHARRVAMMRSRESSCDLILAGYSPSVEVVDLVDSGWLKSIALPQQSRRDGVADVVTEAAARASDFGGERVPGVAWRAIKTGIALGPVLVCVPRSGYVRFLACANCDSALECEDCGGAVQQASAVSQPACQACGQEVESPTCLECESTSFRMAVVGASKILEDLRRAFPRATIVESSAQAGVLARVSSEPQIVVATTGAEPTADGRFQATVVLDGMFTLRGTWLDAGQVAVRRWMRLVAGTKSAVEGGVVVLTGNPGDRLVQAIVRMDPVGWAKHDLAERSELGLPPTARYIQLRGSKAELDGFVDFARPQLETIQGIRIVPSPTIENTAGVYIIVPARQGRELTSELSTLVHQWFGSTGDKNALKVPVEVAGIPVGARELRIEVDPVTL